MLIFIFEIDIEKSIFFFGISYGIEILESGRYVKVMFYLGYEEENSCYCYIGNWLVLGLIDLV